jgi:hypothetical protein
MRSAADLRLKPRGHWDLAGYEGLVMLYSWSSLTQIVAVIYNAALVVPFGIPRLIINSLWTALTTLLDCDNGCNRLELAHVMHLLYVERLPISFHIFCRFRSSVRIFQNTLVIIIGTNDLILDGYHKSSCFWKEFANLSTCVRCKYIDICWFKVSGVSSA